MKSIILILVGICLAIQLCNSAQDEYEVEWRNFKEKYNKKYSSKVEEELRKNVFIKHLKEINEHNKKYEKKEVTFSMGINDFADMTNVEFQYKTGAKISGTNYYSDHILTNILVEDNEVIPDTVDWYKAGFRTPVKNQGNCGSCYAQAVAAALESRWLFKYNETIRLSTQELVDCTFEYGNMGCQYGDLNNTFTYIMANGVGTYNKNPYVERVTKCKKTEPRYHMKGWKQTIAEDEEDLKRAVAKGPVIGVISTGLMSFQYYKGGVYYDSNCIIDPNSVNHFVLILGYGTNNDGDDYWLIKNQWGPNWGWGGYMFMARNRGNLCGISTEAMYPLV